MSTKTNHRIVQPYLSFEGRCEEALDFYRKAIGAEATVLMRFKDSPDPAMCAPGSLDKVMHASVRIGETTILASDGRCGGQPNFQGIALSVTAPDEADAERLFTTLSEGGSPTAVNQNLLSPLRHGRRSLWGLLDDSSSTPRAEMNRI